MKIQVFGTGCTTCKKLFELTKKMAIELGIDTEVEYITDLQKIVEMGYISTPVLVINGKAMIAGRVPSVDKIKESIEKNR